MRLNSQSESGKWWSSLQGRGEVDGVGIRHLGGIMGGAADFKVGYKIGIASGASEKKFLYPHFSKCGYKQANISRGLLNILKFAVWLSH